MAKPVEPSVATPDPERIRGRRLFTGWRLAGIVVGASTILGLAQFFEPTTGEPPRREVPGEATGPDLTISDAVISSFRRSGELKYRLSAPRIEQFSPLDRTYLSDPDLIINNEPDPPWRVRAARGIVRNASTTSAAEEEVLLEEDVRMEQVFEDGRNYVLVTPAITIYPERQYAETTRDVMITTHAGRTHAVGLQGNLDQGLLKLFSDDEQRVHTIILVDQFK